MDIVDLRGVQIPIVYSNDKSADIRDYIAYLRKDNADPWYTKYFISDQMLFDNSALERYNLEKVDEDNLERFQEMEATKKHMLDNIFYIVTSNLLDSAKEDYGINDNANEYMQTYGINHLNILLYFVDMPQEDERKILDDICRIYPSGRIGDNKILILPPKAYTGTVCSDTTIDISAYVNAIVKLSDMGTLTLYKVKELDDMIQECISHNPSITKIAYFGDCGRIELRAIVAYICLKYNLKYAIADHSEYTWISECNFTYMYGKMSLYERLLYVTGLPLAMKYRPNYTIDVDCRFIDFRAPDVIAAYDFETCEEITKKFSLSDFAMDDFIDYRAMFLEQQHVCSMTPRSNDFTKYDDYATDRKLVDKFISMDKNRNINICNSVLVRDKESDRTVLLLTEGDFSLNTLIESNGVFSIEQFVIEEKTFNKLFSHPQLSTKVGGIPIVLDLYSILILHLFASRPLYLSYYDIALRWVVPLTDNINKDGDVINIFDYISLRQIRSEDESRYFISAFGKPLNFNRSIKQNVVLKLTNRFMSGKEIPR